MLYEPDKLFVVHIGTTICLLTDNKEEAERFREKQLKKYPGWHNTDYLKVSDLIDYGLECYENGGSEAYETVGL